MLNTLRGRLAAILLALALGTVGLVVQAAPAQAANLWHCDLFGNNSWRVCTTVTSAPASGVKVLDRDSGRTYTLRNGTSVFLNAWGWDRSKQCGVDNSYFWQIGWYDGSFHHAYIGDFYLSTGSDKTWRKFPVKPGSSHALGEWYLGERQGNCDVINPDPPE